VTNAVLILIILAPALITYLLKSDAALGFLALCAGFVLSTSVVADLKHLLSETNLSLTDKTLALILLLTPLIITLLTTRRAAGKGPKLYLHILTALCTGGLLALSLGPIINSSSQIDLANSQVWDVLQNIQSIIIGVGALLSLILIWVKGLKHSSKKHK
jgi:hypothetical protein